MTHRDAKRFVRVVRKHDGSLRAFAFRMVGHRVDDVLQEAYLRAFQGLDRFESRSTMRTWLHRIVYTTCVDELRKPQFVTPAPVDERRDLDDGTSSVEVQTMAKLDLAAAMDRLPETQRAALWLVDADGFTYREAAEILDVPDGTLATWVSRGRATVREAMSEEVTQ